MVRIEWQLIPWAEEQGCVLRSNTAFEGAVPRIQRLSAEAWLALLGVNALPRAGLPCEEHGRGDSGPGGHSDMSSVTQSFCAPEE